MFNRNDPASISSLLESATSDPVSGPSRGELIDRYWQAHPRFVFFKSLPVGAHLLDIGAGSGGLVFWKDYLPPARADLAMHAVDQHQGEYFGRYQSFQIANLDTDPIHLARTTFDAVIASHVLEHLADPPAMLAQIARLLAPGGRAYIELPAEHSKHLPKREEYTARGWPMMISNFFDDATHRDTPSLATLVAWGQAAGLQAITSGYVENPYLADALIRAGIHSSDGELLLYGYWAKTQWAQYAIFEKH